jgi:hypothetical protein
VTDNPSTQTTPTKADIQARALAIGREQRAERTVALRAISAKFRDAETAIQNDCEISGGHEWVCLTGEFAHPHFGTGLWPHRCRWCDRRTYL